MRSSVDVGKRSIVDLGSAIGGQSVAKAPLEQLPSTSLEQGRPFSHSNCPRRSCSSSCSSNPNPKPKPGPQPQAQDPRAPVGPNHPHTCRKSATMLKVAELEEVVEAGASGGGVLQNVKSWGFPQNWTLRKKMGGYPFCAQLKFSNMRRGAIPSMCGSVYFYMFWECRKKLRGGLPEE